MHTPHFNIGLVGTGKVATALCDWFSALESVNLNFVMGRDAQKVNHLANLYQVQGHTSYATIPSEETQLIILAVSDTQIKSVAKEIAPYVKDHQLLVHTSGATPSEVLQHATANHGIMYPLQTFTAGQPLNYQEIPLLISAATQKGLQLLHQFTTQLGNPVAIMDDMDRRVLHVAAVFANNFTNALYHLAFQIMENHQLDPHLLLPLIQETTQKLTYLSPAESQTGPAIRKDQITIDRHLQILAQNPDWQALYQALTHYIQREINPDH